MEAILNQLPCVFNSFFFLIFLSDKITELLSRESVNSDTLLVLVNAIYFKGNWEKQFNKEDTREMPFKVSKVNTEQ